MPKTRASTSRSSNSVSANNRSSSLDADDQHPSKEGSDDAGQEASSSGSGNFKENIHCPICLSVMIEPVTLPCNHEMCRSCLDATLAAASMACPLCRTRLSAWVRRKRAGPQGLVNHDKWKRIQEAYPEYTRRKLAGETVQSPESASASPCMSPVKPCHQLAQPGELRREYEAQLEAARSEQVAEEAASSALIEQLAAEDMEVQQQIENDESLAQRMSRSDGSCARRLLVQTPQSSKRRKRMATTRLEDFLAKHRTESDLSQAGEVSAMSPYVQHSSTGCPDDLVNRAPPTGAALRCDSVDSIGPEVNVFAPIEPSPRTPTKKRFPDSLFEDVSDEEYDAASDANSNSSNSNEIVRPTAKRDTAKENCNGLDYENGQESASPGSGMAVTESLVGQRVLGEWILPDSEGSRKRPAVPLPRRAKRNTRSSNKAKFARSNSSSGNRSLLDFVVASPAAGGSDEVFARKLQRQYDTEHRHGMTAFRFKGSDDFYQLRGGSKARASSSLSASSASGRSSVTGTGTPSSSTGASSVDPEH